MSIIKVTQRHINIGVQGSCECCPIALAIYDYLAKTMPIDEYLSCEVTVGAVGPVITIKNREDEIKMVTYSMSGKLSRFIRSFDMAKKVKPFEFDLDKLTRWPV